MSPLLHCLTLCQTKITLVLLNILQNLTFPTCPVSPATPATPCVLLALVSGHFPELALLFHIALHSTCCSVSSNAPSLPDELLCHI